VEDFQRAKIMQSVRVASAGMIPEADLDEVTDRALRRLNPRARVPIPTEEIGHEVIEQLLQVGEITAAWRYALTFLTARGKVKSVGDLRNWIDTNLPKTWVPNETEERPRYVEKASTPTKRGRKEDFSLLKLWAGLEKATKGLLPTAKAPGGLAESESWTNRLLLGAIVAAVLDEVRGQPTVTSGQLSAAAMRVLRAVAPFAFFRFASVAKKYAAADAFAEEYAGLLSFPSPTIELAQYRMSAERIVAEVAALQKDTSSEAI